MQELVLQYIGGKDATDDTSIRVRDLGLTDRSVRIFNLARQWIQSLLVHCLSKRNRIDFGLLIAKDEPNQSVMNKPASRQIMVVPFVGKDRPSAATEFASPNVMIGAGLTQ